MTVYSRAELEVRVSVQTLDFFYTGRFLAKMQAQGFNLETAMLLGYQEPSDMAPSPSNPGTTRCLHVTGSRMRVTP